MKGDDLRMGTGELAAALAAAVSGEVKFDEYTRHLYSRDASMYAIEPIGVVFPRDAAAVAGLVCVAAAARVAGVPPGAPARPAGPAVGPALATGRSPHS